MSMNVSISSPLEQFVQEQVKIGFYNSASEVVRAGLRLLIKQQVQQNLDRAIAIGLEQVKNGQVKEMNDEFWDDLKADVVKRIENKKKK